jgi:hypothetical protein
MEEEAQSSSSTVITIVAFVLLVLGTAAGW